MFSSRGSRTTTVVADRALRRSHRPALWPSKHPDEAIDEIPWPKEIGDLLLHPRVTYCNQWRRLPGTSKETPTSYATSFQTQRGLRSIDEIHQRKPISISLLLPEISDRLPSIFKTTTPFNTGRPYSRRERWCPIRPCTDLMTSSKQPWRYHCSKSTERDTATNHRNCSSALSSPTVLTVLLQGGSDNGKREPQLS